MRRKRRIANYNFGRRKKIERSCRQRRHVQRLANVAGIVCTICMLVQERAADCEIQNRRASHQGQGASYPFSLEFGIQQFHQLTQNRKP